jgi:branched-chain amino acid transport system permease protein
MFDKPLAFWLIQSLNSLSFGGLLFLLSAGFSLIFGLMRIANLSHGAYFMLGAYVGMSVLRAGYPFGVAMLAGGFAVMLLGGLIERFVIRRLAGQPLSQVLATLGIAFIIADGCLVLWTGDPQQLASPEWSRGVAAALWLLMEKTRLGAMIRAGVDDMEMARGVGIPVSRLFTLVFCLGSFLAGAGGVLGGPILSVYPGLDTDMLPLALVVVILGGVGSLAGAFVGSFLTGFVYTFGQALLPDLAYMILFLPMIIVLAVRPRGLFGKIAA